MVEMKVRFEPEMYEILKQVLTGPGEAAAIIEVLRKNFRGVTITIDLKPLYGEEQKDVQ